MIEIKGGAVLIAVEQIAQVRIWDRRSESAGPSITILFKNGGGSVLYSYDVDSHCIQDYKLIREAMSKQFGVIS